MVETKQKCTVTALALSVTNTDSIRFENLCRLRPRL